MRVRWSADRRGIIDSFEVEERDALGEGGSWPMRVKLLLAPADAAARPEVLTVTLEGTGMTSVREALGKRRPAFVFANFEDYGYGRFLLDDKSRAYVARNLGSDQRRLSARASVGLALGVGARSGDVPADFIELAIDNAARERDEVMLAFILSRAQTAFTRYLSDAQRTALARGSKAHSFRG